jgi:hypothetical protein
MGVLIPTYGGQRLAGDALKIAVGDTTSNWNHHFGGPIYSQAIS